MTHIRKPTRADLPALQYLVGAIGLFPPDMLPDLIAPWLAGDAPAEWLVATAGDDLVGLCYAEPEPMTEGTWNMRALGTHPDHHRTGIGQALVAALEDTLAAQGHRLLIVDTSGTDDFATARAFYAATGYNQIARIPDFWAAGDDKVTFRKAL